MVLMASPRKRGWPGPRRTRLKGNSAATQAPPQKTGVWGLRPQPPEAQQERCRRPIKLPPPKGDSQPPARFGLIKTRTSPPWPGRAWLAGWWRCWGGGVSAGCARESGGKILSIFQRIGIPNHATVTRLSSFCHGKSAPCRPLEGGCGGRPVNGQNLPQTIIARLALVPWLAYLCVGSALRCHPSGRFQPNRTWLLRLCWRQGRHRPVALVGAGGAFASLAAAGDWANLHRQAWTQLAKARAQSCAFWRQIGRAHV